MTEPQILTTSVPKKTFDLNRAVQVAATARGISKARLTLEILQRQFGRQRLTPQEYFLHGAHRTNLTDTERGAFIGGNLGSIMCAKLCAAPGSRVANILRNKLACDLEFRRFGLPTPAIQAFAGSTPVEMPYPVLDNPNGLKRFLDHEAVVPIFGKPASASQSVGAASIVARGELGRLILGDGRDVSSAQFAEEVFRYFPRGYIFQDLVLPNPKIGPLTGPALATARLVTLRIGSKISLAYGGVKWPGKGKMVDGSASLTSLESAVDLASGKIIRLQDPLRLGGSDLAENPVNNATVVGKSVPDWDKTVALAIAAHEAFPEQRIFGGDFGLSDQGPLIVELNTHPGMAFYQKTTARGLWNSDLAPLFAEALGEAGHRRASRELPLPWAVPA